MAVEIPVGKNGRRATKAGKTSTKICKKCGFKIGGPNHEEGEHHKKGQGNGSAQIGKSR